MGEGSKVRRALYTLYKAKSVVVDELMEIDLSLEYDHLNIRSPTVEEQY